MFSKLCRVIDILSYISPVNLTGLTNSLESYTVSVPKHLYDLYNRETMTDAYLSLLHTSTLRRKLSTIL